MNRSLAAALFITLAAALGGCDAVERQQEAFTEMLLVDAGFQKMPLGSEPPARATLVFVAPEHCGCVFAGSAEANTRYQNALEAQAIARAMIWDGL